jgi:CRISPR-associated exonuclease Cas4
VLLFYGTLSFIIISCGVVLWFISSWLRRAAGLPDGIVLFSDSGYERLSSFSIVSHRLGLVGKPDYLLRDRQGVVPVEYKATMYPLAGPYWNHLVQLGAYLLLVEEYFGEVSYGVLKYKDRSVKVEFTRELRTKVLGLLRELKESKKSEIAAIKRSHELAGKCASCGFFTVCDEALR